MSPVLIAVTRVNEAVAIFNAFMPLLQQHMSGQKEVTQEDVAAALNSMEASLKRLDDEIERQGG